MAMVVHSITQNVGHWIANKQYQHNYRIKHTDLISHTYVNE